MNRKFIDQKVRRDLKAENKQKLLCI
jgi:hypothetical protein